MTIARTILTDWLIAITISVTVIYSFGLIIGVGSGFPPETFAASAFMVFIGYAGILIGLGSSSYAPELIPIFIGLTGFWAFVFWLMRRRFIQRPIKVAILAVCLLSLWAFGMVGIAATQVV